MKYPLLTGLMAAGLLAGCAMDKPATSSAAPAPAAAASGAMTVALKPQNASGESGTATLTPEGNNTRVVVKLTGAPAGVAQPMHVHAGSCATLDPNPKYGLNSIQNGTSSSLVPVPIATLMAGGHAINVHKSADDIKTYVACGDLKS